MLPSRNQSLSAADTTRKLEHIHYQLKLSLQSALQNSQVSPSIYDTAWITRYLNAKESEGGISADQSIDWLIAQQQPDGGWGHNTPYPFVSDRLVSTLSVINAFSIAKAKRPDLAYHIERGANFANRLLPKLFQDSYFSVGLELITPTLISESQQLGLDIGTPKINRFIERRDRKFALFLQDLDYDRSSTLLHSLEALSPFDLDWLQLQSLQDSNGAFLSSPSATTFMVQKTGNAKSSAYLQQLLEIEHSAEANTQGTVPVNTPIDIFQLNWCFEMILKLGLRPYFPTLFAEAISKLEQYWTDSGISWATTFHLPDLDNTATSYYLLTNAEVECSADVFEHFYSSSSIFCFPHEQDSSPTHLLHLLSALNLTQAHPKLKQRTLDLVLTLLNEQGWQDKWHLSPYYVIALAVEPFSTLAPEYLKKMLSFIMAGQNTDSGWGNAGRSNQEETAWACYALILALRSPIGSNPTYFADQLKNSLTAGIAYMVSNPLDASQMPSLWVDKCLYTPITIVQTLVQSVLLSFNIHFGQAVTDHVHNRVLT